MLFSDAVKYPDISSTLMPSNAIKVKRQVAGMEMELTLYKSSSQKSENMARLEAGGCWRLDGLITTYVTLCSRPGLWCRGSPSVSAAGAQLVGGHGAEESRCQAAADS